MFYNFKIGEQKSEIAEVKYNSIKKIKLDELIKDFKKDDVINHLKKVINEMCLMI